MENKSYEVIINGVGKILQGKKIKTPLRKSLIIIRQILLFYAQ